MKKILRRLFLIIIVSLIFCFSKQNNVYGVGFVYQAWAEDGGLYFRTFTSPLEDTVDDYINDSKYKNYKDGNSLKTDASSHGKFWYKGKKSYEDYSKWVKSVIGNDYLHKNKSEINESYTGFSTTAITFHEKQRIYNSGSSSYKYAIFKENYVVDNELDNIQYIFKNGISTKTTSKGEIKGSIGKSHTLGETESKATLVRMTLLAPSSNKSDNAIYVSDRKLTSTQVKNIKDSGVVTTLNGKQIVYVSQTLSYYSFNQKIRIDASDPNDFIDSTPEERWKPGTRGQGIKALGSAFNLYDNILVFPTEVCRKVTVQKVKLSDHGKPTTVLNDSNRGTPTVRVGPDKIENGTVNYNSSDYKQGSEQYLGYNISYGGSSSAAKSSMTDQVSAGSINNKATTCSLKDYTGKEDQYVIIEMYYTDQPKEEEESINFVSRYIIYSDTGDILESGTGESVNLFPDDTKTFAESYFSSKVSGATYLGYEITKDDSTIPESENIDNNVNSCSVSYNNYTGSKTVYINFKYTKTQSGTINVRYIYYDAAGIKKYMTSKTQEIKGSSGTQNITVKTDSLYPASDYKGYIVLYDNKLPSCYASVESDTYQLDKSKYRTGICINFMFQAKPSEFELGKPTQSDDGYLKMSGVGISGIGQNDTAHINSNTTDISQSSVLSLPLGETAEFKMTNLQKYYIAGLRIQEKEYKSDKDDDDKTNSLTLVILHVTIIPLIDVNKGTLVGGPGIYIDKYTFLVPFKYLKYNIEKSATYKLDSSKVYYPDGNGSNSTIGYKLFDSVVSNIILNYGITDDVDYKTEPSGINALVMESLDVKATFKSGIDVSYDTPTGVIYRIVQEDDPNTPLINEKGRRGDEYAISASTIKSFSIGSNVGSLVTGEIVGFIGGMVGKDTIISTLTTKLASYGGIDGIIIEKVPTYTNVSTDINSLWQAVQTFFKCGFNVTMQTIASLFGVGWNGADTVISCKDVPLGFLKFIDFWKSLIKPSVFVYEAQYMNSDGELYEKAYTVQNADGSLSPQFMTRAKLDKIRNVEKTFSLGTTSEKTKLYYQIGTGATTDIGSTLSMMSIADSFASDISSALRNIIKLITKVDVDDTLPISRKRISDLNFTTDSDEINWLQKIKNGLSESVLGDLRSEYDICFPGICVCI